MFVRIRGGVLERYLRMLYGARIEKSPDSSRKLVGLFIDLENIVGAAASPESLGDQLLAFAGRFGTVVAPTAVATSYSLSLAGWDARAVEAAFIARGIRFEMPPQSIESRENAADMTLQPIITQTAEQYNLAEVIIVSPPVPPVQEVSPPQPPSVADVPFEDVLAMVLQLRDLQQRLIDRVAGHRASEIPSDMRERLAMEVGLCRRWTSLIDDWLGSSWTFWPKKS